MVPRKAPHEQVGLGKCMGDPLNGTMQPWPSGFYIVRSRRGGQQSLSHPPPTGVSFPP